jgi:hypothetical protein
MTDFPNRPEEPLEILDAPPPPPETKWPLVVGIISLVFAGLALICTPAGLVSQQVMPQAQKMMQNLPAWMHIYQIAATVIGMGEGVLLLIAGVMLLRRSAPTRVLHMIFAVIRIVITIVGTPIALMIMSGIQAPPQAERMMYISGGIGVLIGLPLALAYPVFLLIWFMRRKIRDEVESWRARAGRGA